MKSRKKFLFSKKYELEIEMILDFENLSDENKSLIQNIISNPSLGYLSDSLFSKMNYGCQLFFFAKHKKLKNTSYQSHNIPWNINSYQFDSSNNLIFKNSFQLENYSSIDYFEKPVSLENYKIQLNIHNGVLVEKDESIMCDGCFDLNNEQNDINLFKSLILNSFSIKNKSNVIIKDHMCENDFSLQESLTCTIL